MLELDGTQFFTGVLVKYLDQSFMVLSKASEQQYVEADIVRRDFCMEELYEQAAEQIRQTGLAPFEKISEFLKNNKSVNQQMGK